MYNDYEVSSLTRTCTLIGLIIDGLSITFLIFINLFMNRIFNFIEMVEHQSDILLVRGLVGGIVGFFSIFFIGFYILNLIIFTKLINKKLTIKNAKVVSIYQVIYGVISLGGNTISGILYIVSGLNSNNTLSYAEENKEL